MKRKLLPILLLTITASLTACGSADSGSERGSIEEAPPIRNETETAEEKTGETALPEEKERPEESADNTETAAGKPTVTEAPEEPETTEAPVPDYTGITVSARDLDGNSVSMQDIFSAHKYTVVNMWATWCGPCVGEIPELAAMEEELAEKDCALIGLLTDSDAGSIRDAKDILSDSGAGYPVIVMNRDLSSLFQSDYIPATFFVDQSGNIIGEPIVGADPDGYMKRIDSLLK